MIKTESSSVFKITTKIILTATVFLFLFWFIYKIQEALFLFFIAFILSSALYPPINWLKKKKFPSHLSILIFYLVFLALVTIIGVLLGGLLAEEGRQFIANFPVYLDQAQESIHKLPFGLNRTNLFMEISSNARNLISQGLNLALSSLEYVLTLFKSVVGIATVLVFTFFFLSDTAYFEKTLLGLVPASHRKRIDLFIKQLIAKIGAYVRGQFIIMCIIGILLWLTLSLMGVPYALILGLAGFLLDAIPIVGPIISALFGMTIALGHSPILAIWVGLAYFVIQHVESYFLSPTILGRSLGMHPFWILLSILLSEMILGLKGLIIAVPLGVTISLLIREFYIEGFIKEAEPTTLPLSATD